MDDVFQLETPPTAQYLSIIIIVVAIIFSVLSTSSSSSSFFTNSCYPYFVMLMVCFINVHKKELKKYGGNIFF